MLISTNLLSGCAIVIRERANIETRLPPSFTTGRIRTWMPLQEAVATFPEQKPEWVRPRTLSLQFTQTAEVLAARTGMFPLPMGFFVDEELVEIMSVVAHNGKSLTSAEIDRIHAKLLMECEALYGAKHDQAVVQSDSMTGNEYSKIIWNKSDYIATLGLPRITNQRSTQMIAALEVRAAKKKEPVVMFRLEIANALFKQ